MDIITCSISHMYIGNHVDHNPRIIIRGLLLVQPNISTKQKEEIEEIRHYADLCTMCKEDLFKYLKELLLNGR